MKMEIAKESRLSGLDRFLMAACVALVAAFCCVIQLCALGLLLSGLQETVPVFPFQD